MSLSKMDEVGVQVCYGLEEVKEGLIKWFIGRFILTFPRKERYKFFLRIQLASQNLTKYA